MQLYNARARVLQPGEEALWGTATVDLMSEEEDTIVDERPVWVVQPPPRSAELSELCSVLQQRLDKDEKYVATHRQRLTSLQANGHQCLYMADAAAVLIFGVLYVLFSVLHDCALQ